MASLVLRASLLALQSRTRASVVQCALCCRPVLRKPLPLRWMSATTATVNHNEPELPSSLHELVSQGRYIEAIDQWERAKNEGVADPALYSSVMQLAAQLGGAEATRHVKEDMDRQGWNMDHSCSLHYLGCLASEGNVNEVLKFINSSPMKEDPAFLADCASLLLENGHSQAAVDICGLSPPSPPHPHLSLLAVQLEAMGRLGRVVEMETLVKTLYPDQEGVSTVPREVELALANGLSLADQPSRALSLLKNTRSRSVPMKCLALLLESALREENFTIAAEAFSLFWNKSTMKPSDRAILASPSSLPHHSSHHHRAITAAVHLQAHARKEAGSRASEFLTNFLDKDFCQEQVDNKYPPSPEMYQALLFLGCYHAPALIWAERTIRQCAASGQEVPADTLTSWTRVCGTLPPQQALKVIRLVRVTRHYCNVDFDLRHYEDLLCLHYQCDSSTQQKEALDAIRGVKNSLDRSDMLRSTEAFNHILQAVTRIPVVGAHYTTYNDMIANHVDPNLHTFHLLLDGTLAEGSVKNTKKAAYFLWRSLMKEWPRVKPEIELINKFIRCCLVCSDQERAFVFLAALEDCSVEPNFDTFSLLFKICHSANDHQGFDNVLKLAQHWLPDQRADISAVAHKLQMQWRAEEDFNIANSILGQLDAPK